MKTSLFVIGASLVMSVSTARAEEQPFICRIESQLPGGKPISFTGFKVKGLPGIITALHGVHGATKIDAIFHDPDPRRVPMTLSLVDIDRDIAVLVPVDEEDALPKGGLGQGFWGNAAQVETLLAGKPVEVIGYPIGIELKCATTQLTIRKPAIAQLTDLINPTARKELKDRGSPATSARMLSLQGHFLPGHSGAPIFDADDGVIGIGIGGLDEGRVGHGWATPFEDIELKAKADETVSARLAKLPVHQPTYSFSLIFDPTSRQTAPVMQAVVTTVVESDDGSPILGLRRPAGGELKNEIGRLADILKALRNGENQKYTPGGELQRIMKQRVLLPSGTPVEVLAESGELETPTETGSPLDGLQALQGAVSQLYRKVRVQLGDEKGEELWVPAIAIRRRAGFTTGTTLNPVPVKVPHPRTNASACTCTPRETGSNGTRSVSIDRFSNRVRLGRDWWGETSR